MYRRRPKSGPVVYKPYANHHHLDYGTSMDATFARPKGQHVLGAHVTLGPLKTELHENGDHLSRD
jgi:hypothetical protein